MKVLSGLFALAPVLLYKPPRPAHAQASESSPDWAAEWLQRKLLPSRFRP